jgi:hypothetical protein
MRAATLLFKREIWQMDNDTDRKLDAILDAIKGLDARVTKIEVDTTGAGGSDKSAGQAKVKKMAIKEFLLENPPPDDIRRTLAVGYFLENDEGMSSFTRAELLQGYSEGKESPPTNIGVNIAHCIKQGHMMEAREKKGNKTAYALTRSGEQFVAARYKKPGGK